MWGEKGYMRLKRYGKDEPCGVDVNPSDGEGCEGGKFHGATPPYPTLPHPLPTMHNQKVFLTNFSV